MPPNDNCRIIPQLYLDMWKNTAYNLIVMWSYSTYKKGIRNMKLTTNIIILNTMTFNAKESGEVFNKVTFAIDLEDSGEHFQGYSVFETFVNKVSGLTKMIGKTVPATIKLSKTKDSKLSPTIIAIDNQTL